MSRFHAPLTFVALAVAVIAVWSPGPPVAAQFGGGGFAPGGLSELEPQSPSGETLIQGGGAHVNGSGATAPTQFILVSPDGARAWGYSTETGEWKPAPLDGKGTEKPIPIVATAVAVIADGQKVHAFSSLKGEWDTLELPEGVAPQPVVGTDYSQVRTATDVSIFSARTGNWSTVKFTEK